MAPAGSTGQNGLHDHIVKSKEMPDILSTRFQISEHGSCDESGSSMEKVCHVSDSVSAMKSNHVCKNLGDRRGVHLEPWDD